jgi:hypothetical protein
MRELHVVRGVVLIYVAACATPRPPPPPDWPTLEPLSPAYNARIVGLRTSLGRAAIRLEMKGVEDTIHSATCTDSYARRLQTGCLRCELVGDGDPIDDDMLDALKTAFDRYPTEFLRATHIEHVSLCKHIEYEDMTREFGTAGTVDFTRRRLFISVESFLDRVYDASGSFTVEDIVHHELFHLIEHEHMSRDMSDPEWRVQNPIGFEYRPAPPGAERPTGFVNAYASTNEIEDRASTFQYLMARPADLCEIAREDAIVRAKLKLVWTRVAKLAGDDFLRTRGLCGGL